MMSIPTLLMGTFLQIVIAVNGQRVAPGVPPQQYNNMPQQNTMYQNQQPQHQQQYQPPVQQQQYQPTGQQQVPVQQQQQMHTDYQQQVPVQHQQQAYQQQPQHQQQVPQTQPEAGGGHHHGHHGGQQPVLNPANIQHEREHIAEHMEVPIDTSKMTEQELQFHYFKMHDSDNNNKLDGCELIKSLIHWHEQGSKEQHQPGGAPPVEEKVFSDDELVALIDPILQMDDTSRDGFIDYPEFIKAQQKAASQNKPKH